MRLVTVILLAALAAGCASQTPEGGTVDEQQATLAARPTMAEITDRYERMQTELRQRLVDEIGISEWVKRSDGTSSGCGAFPDVPTTESRSLGNWLSDGNLPDDKWHRARVIVTEVTGRYGFTPDFVVDRPGSHTIIGIDQYGASYDFGTGKNTVLGVSTGCHRNPTDSPPP